MFIVALLTSAAALVDQGNNWIEAGFPQEATAYYENSLIGAFDDKEKAIITYNLATNQAMIGKYDEALVQFENLLLSFGLPSFLRERAAFNSACTFLLKGRKDPEWNEWLNFKADELFDVSEKSACLWLKERGGICELSNKPALEAPLLPHELDAQPTALDHLIDQLESFIGYAFILPFGEEFSNDDRQTLTDKEGQIQKLLGSTLQLILDDQKDTFQKGPLTPEYWKRIVDVFYVGKKQENVVQTNLQTSPFLFKDVILPSIEALKHFRDLKEALKERKGAETKESTFSTTSFAERLKIMQLEDSKPIVIPLAPNEAEPW